MLFNVVNEMGFRLPILRPSGMPEPPHRQLVALTMEAMMSPDSATRDFSELAALLNGPFSPLVTACGRAEHWILTVVARRRCFNSASASEKGFAAPQTRAIP